MRRCAVVSRKCMRQEHFECVDLFKLSQSNDDWHRPCILWPQITFECVILQKIMHFLYELQENTSQYAHHKSRKRCCLQGRVLLYIMETRGGGESAQLHCLVSNKYSSIFWGCGWPGKWISNRFSPFPYFRAQTLAFAWSDGPPFDGVSFQVVHGVNCATSSTQDLVHWSCPPFSNINDGNLASGILELIWRTYLKLQPISDGCLCFVTRIPRSKHASCSIRFIVGAVVRQRRKTCSFTKRRSNIVQSMGHSRKNAGRELVPKSDHCGNAQSTIIH